MSAEPPVAGSAAVDADDADDAFAVLFGVAARQLVAAADADAFIAWFAHAAPLLVPALFAQANEPEQFARVLARGLYGITPLPQHGYLPHKLPRPGRNEPCFCGSGRKYKHCCEPIDSGMPFPAINMLRYVLDATPRAAWAALPASRVDVDAVADAAHQWSEEGREREVVALLEPWFAGDGALPGRRAPLFDALMDAYLALDRPRKREALVQAALARGDRHLQAAAWQRRAVMRADRGQHAEALDAFREAQRLDPDDPALAHLEITLLIGAGRGEQARERARFWLARARRDSGYSPELVELLQQAAQDPALALYGIAESRVPPLADLRQRLRTLPPPAIAHEITGPAGGEGELKPAAPLGRAEARWRAAFPQAKPALTMLGEGDPAAFDCADRWLPLLDREPLLWQSFDVLDDLAMAVHARGVLGAEQAVLVPLLDRAVALLRLHLAAAGMRALPWGFLTNRPALRCVSARLHLALEAGDRATALGLAEWLVRDLNPHDNHGWRGPLMRLYLQAGRYDDAIALAERYPDDLAELTLTQVLALYCAGRLPQAEAALRRAAADHRRAVKTLLADRVRRPKGGGFGIEFGGAEEAWLYREAHRALWQEHGALAWAAQVLAARTRKAGQLQ